MYLILVHCDECCVWFDGYINVFMCVFNLKFLVKRRDGGRGCEFLTACNVRLAFNYLL
jgi:hypothetical protein